MHEGVVLHKRTRTQIKRKFSLPYITKVLGQILLDERSI